VSARSSIAVTGLINLGGASEVLLKPSASAQNSLQKNFASPVSQAIRVSISFLQFSHWTISSSALSLHNAQVLLRIQENAIEGEAIVLADAGGGLEPRRSWLRVFFAASCKVL